MRRYVSFGAPVVRRPPPGRDRGGIMDNALRGKRTTEHGRAQSLKKMSGGDNDARSSCRCAREEKKKKNSLLLKETFSLFRSFHIVGRGRPATSDDDKDTPAIALPSASSVLFANTHENKTEARKKTHDAFRFSSLAVLSTPKRKQQHQPLKKNSDRRQNLLPRQHDVVRREVGRLAERAQPKVFAGRVLQAVG